MKKQKKKRVRVHIRGGCFADLSITSLIDQKQLYHGVLGPAAGGGEPRRYLLQQLYDVMLERSNVEGASSDGHERTTAVVVRGKPGRFLF